MDKEEKALNKHHKQIDSWRKRGGEAKSKALAKKGGNKCESCGTYSNVKAIKHKSGTGVSHYCTSCGA